MITPLVELDVHEASRLKKKKLKFYVPLNLYIGY